MKLPALERQIKSSGISSSVHYKMLCYVLKEPNLPVRSLNFQKGAACIGSFNLLQ
jgi:hypothetical protein